MKKALTQVWERTADAMRRKPDVNEMGELIGEISARLGEIDRKLPAIREGGIERIKVIESSTPADLIALDQALNELQAEEKQLRYRSSELHKRKRTLEAETGIKEAATNRNNLTKAVEDAVRAERVYLKARGQATAIVSKVIEARNGARREGIDASDCWLKTEDLMRLGFMLYPGDEHKDQEKRFDWSRDKAKTLDDSKAIALGDESLTARSSIQLRRLLGAAGGAR